MRLRLGAAGAERQCAPASPVGRGRAAPQLHRKTAAMGSVPAQCRSASCALKTLAPMERFYG